MTAAASPKVQIDTDEVRVTEWTLPPHSAIGFHRHALDYIVVPLTNSDMTIVRPDGARTMAKLKIGQSYFRKSGVEHDVLNETDTEIVFIEVEMKRRA